MPYNAAGSGGSNLGPRNPALAEAIQARIALLRPPIRRIRCLSRWIWSPPRAALTHISPAAAVYQAARVARARATCLAPRSMR